MSLFCASGRAALTSVTAQGRGIRKRRRRDPALLRQAPVITSSRTGGKKCNGFLTSGTRHFTLNPRLTLFCLFLHACMCLCVFVCALVCTGETVWCLIMTSYVMYITEGVVPHYHIPYCVFYRAAPQRGPRCGPATQLVSEEVQDRSAGTVLTPHFCLR